jgi:secernin
VELLLDLVERHGQGDTGADASFLVADPQEAYLIETAGTHWVMQEIGQVRAASDLSTIHQDWIRISRGLAGQAIQNGWWPADGSKLDFADAIADAPVGHDSALRRWGRATYLLEQQSGHIDACFLRRLLSDHYEGMQGETDPLQAEVGPYPLCQHGPERMTVASMVAPLHADPALPPLAWCAFGPPCLGVYFPIFLDGELPAPFRTGDREESDDSIWWRTHQLNRRLFGHPERAAEVCAAFDRVQARFDQEAEECAAEFGRKSLDRADWQRRAGLFMQHCLERYLDTIQPLLRHDFALAAVERG